MIGYSFGAGGRAGGWSPISETDCNLWVEAPGYADNGAGNGTWVALVGGNLTDSTAAPVAASGEPSFNGSSNRIRSATDLNALMSLTEGTIFAVVKPTAHPADEAASGSPYHNKLFVSNTANSTFGLSMADDGGTDRYFAHIYDGSYKVVKVAATYNVYRSVVTRWAQSATIDLMVDGLDNNGAVGFSSTAIGTWGSTSGTLDVGGNYINNRWYQGFIRAMAIFSTKKSDAVVAKWNAFARNRYGTP
jgi:hypothetical protein